MINSAGAQPPVFQPQNSGGATEARRVLTMVKNERMGGMVPKWETVTVTKAQTVEQTLAAAQGANPGPSFKTVLRAYQEPAATGAAIDNAKGTFGFGDLLDMINPLQHIPVVGHFYRQLTGDEIKPIGRIMGGAFFAGPLGAAGNLLNVIVEHETGKDIADNAFALALHGEAPSFKIAANTAAASPQETLNKAANGAPGYDLPASLLAFTGNGDTKVPRATRSPITEVILRPLPGN